jgi:hypothetical protein
LFLLGVVLLVLCELALVALLGHRRRGLRSLRRLGNRDCRSGALGRRCYAMEIDPRFVQLSIERWQGFSGRTADRLDG